MSIQCQELNEGFFLINFVGADQVSNIISSSRTKSTTYFSAILLMSSFQSLLMYLVKLDTRYICSTKYFLRLLPFFTVSFFAREAIVEDKYVLQLEIFLMRKQAQKSITSLMKMIYSQDFSNLQTLKYFFKDSIDVFITYWTIDYLFIYVFCTSCKHEIVFAFQN